MNFGQQLPLPLPGARVLRRTPRCTWLKIGQRHPNVLRATGKYNLCLTPNQTRKLGVASVAPLGCGVFACAYPHLDPDKVVKITRDGSDVAGLYLGQGLSRVPKLYGRYKLTSPAHWAAMSYDDRSSVAGTSPGPVYGLVVERVQPMQGAQKRAWSKRINRIAWYLNQGIRQWRHARSLATYQPSLSTVRKALNSCPKDKKNREACRRLARDMLRAQVELARRGVALTDLHIGNIGIAADGHWKVIDLGFSERGTGMSARGLRGARRR